MRKLVEKLSDKDIKKIIFLIWIFYLLCLFIQFGLSEIFIWKIGNKFSNIQQSTYLIFKYIFICILIIEIISFPFIKRRILKKNDNDIMISQSLILKILLKIKRFEKNKINQMVLHYLHKNNEIVFFTFNISSSIAIYGLVLYILGRNKMEFYYFFIISFVFMFLNLLIFLLNKFNRKRVF